MVGDVSVTVEEVTCQQFVELVTDYVEGTLTTPTLSHVEVHLVMCDWCVAYLQQMNTTIASLGALTETDRPEPSDTLLSTLRARRESRT